MAKIKTTRNKCSWGCGEKGTLLHFWWKCKLGQPPWETVWRFLKKLKTKLTIQELHSYVFTQIWQTHQFKGIHAPHVFTTALFAIISLSVHVDGFVNKKCVCIYIYTHTHTHTHIYIHTHTQWNIVQPLKRMTSCHLHGES